MGEKQSSRSFRMPSEVLKGIDIEARNRRVSTNSLMTGIATGFYEFGRFAEKIRCVTVSHEIFSAIANLGTADRLEQIGDRGGSKEPKQIFTLYNLKPTLNSYLHLFIDPLKRHAGLFDAVWHEEERKLAVSHDLGSNGSALIKGYIGASMRSLLKIKPEIEMTGNTVVLYLRK